MTSLGRKLVNDLRHAVKLVRRQFVQLGNDVFNRRHRTSMPPARAMLFFMACGCCVNARLNRFNLAYIVIHFKLLKNKQKRE